jgi:PTS system glucose-specific IIA component
MFSNLDEKIEYLTAPASGKVIDLKKVTDQSFAKKNLGDGFAIELDDNIIKSPCAGEIVQVFTTGHALGIKTESGLEILLHIGINTVKLAGRGFTKLIKNGDKVKAGTPIIEVDLDYLENNISSLATPVVITNMEKVKSIEVLRYGKVESGNNVLKVELY